jgi:beta-lactamase class A
LPLFFGGLLLAALILLGWEWFNFQRQRSRLGTQITVAGVPVSGLKSADALKTVADVYGQPVQLDYEGNPIMLDPVSVGFHLNGERMLADLNAKKSTGSSYLTDLWNYLWRQSSSSADVALVAEYDHAKLKDFLVDVATRYEQTAGSANFDINAMTFSGGTAGQKLDIDASVQAIDTALRSSTNRRVQLVLKPSGEGSAANMSVLQQAILDFFKSKNFPTDGPDTFASVVIIDLKTGQELSINPDVAYAAESTIKIPIMLNMFRTLSGAPPDVNIKWDMGASILCSNNDASNTLIELTSSKATKRDRLLDGLQQVTDTVQRLGAKNTYINAPIDVGDPNLYFSGPAPKTSPDKRFNTQPDPFSQTTAQDMAVLLNELYDCAQYNGGVRGAFPDNYSQATCKQMVELLSGNIIGRMIELGVPPGTRVAHKNGWGRYKDGWHSSDAAIVFTPGGNYILSIYNWEKIQPGYQQGDIVAWETIEGISRIAYNYFNPTQPMLQSRKPNHPTTADNCVMPDPNHADLLDLNNIRNGRFDAQGHLLPGACENYPDNKECFK